MPREENKEIEEERRAKNAYDLIRIRLNRLEKNIDKPIIIPQRKDDPKPKPPPEFVRNVVGSSAAAGSAEFHIFRNNKRREQERLEHIQKQALKEDLDKEFEERKMARKEAEELKTARKREKRQRQKERKKAKKFKKDGGGKNCSSSSESSDSEEESIYEEGNKGIEEGDKEE
ncbi:unnamed protein product [Meloidogyne enterolobii]|uniref:Uncharacterized protein n=1 Tax=Meloidogyne enterolobii TaxID=390850 RepID=A0ACB1A2W5_MELEN